MEKAGAIEFRLHSANVGARINAESDFEVYSRTGMHSAERYIRGDGFSYVDSNCW
jgi:hypothetical protein